MSGHKLPARRRAQLVDELHDAGLRVTPARLVVLDAIRVTIEQMKVDSVECSSMSAAFEGAGVQMLRDVALEVLVDRGVGTSTGRPLSVTGRGGELACDAHGLVQLHDLQQLDNVRVM